MSTCYYPFIFNIKGLTFSNLDLLKLNVSTAVSKLFKPKSDVVMSRQYKCQYCTRCGSTDIKVKTQLSLFNQLWIKLCK